MISVYAFLASWTSFGTTFHNANAAPPEDFFSSPSRPLFIRAIAAFDVIFTLVVRSMKFILNSEESSVWNEWNSKCRTCRMRWKSIHTRKDVISLSRVGSLLLISRSCPDYLDVIRRVEQSMTVENCNEKLIRIFLMKCESPARGVFMIFI